MVDKWIEDKTEILQKYKKEDRIRKIKSILAIVGLKKIAMIIDSRKDVLSIEQFNRIAYDKICNQEPFMVARFGGSELSLLDSYFKRNVYGDNKAFEFSKNQLCQLSGLFPNSDEIAVNFCEAMFEWCNDVDILGIWEKEMEDFFSDTFCGIYQKTKLEYIEPYYYGGTPWTKALKGKKVLVVHPFEDSIQFQYAKRKLVWGELTENILPDFELHTIKAVQTIAEQKDSRFQDWFEALEYMEKLVRKEEFDVAIVGCGAYGLPLASIIKRMGKCVIHMGGATQILFGISGSRWDDHPVISKMYNEHWIRPLEEKPKGFENVEGGCYW